MEHTENIRALVQIKTILERLTVNTNDNLLQQITTLVNEYLNTCEHRIVSDYIDITPDNGYTIQFCDICMQTF